MDNRIWLNADDVIWLCEYGDEDRIPRKFTIDGRLKKSGSDDDSCGSSSICYRARLYKSGQEHIGVLKEFYPAAALSLERDSDGQVISNPKYQPDYDSFQAALKDYLKSQATLLRKKDQGSNDELSSFIPDFELYQGCGRDGNIVGTGYIWFQTAPFETFEKVCSEICVHPEEEPEHKLVMALRGIRSLAEAVCALHCANLLHRDIKPENFGFNKLRGKVRYEDVQLIDLDSVCSATEKAPYEVISEGYTEPEATLHKGPEYYATNESDIYSIGASLFHAIIVPDEPLNEDRVYDPDYYDNLRNLVNESRLIRASEANSHPRLRGLLIRILEKSLSPRRNRYKKCEDLIADLDEALCLALPSDLAKQYVENRKWVWNTVSEELDRNVGKDSTLSILYHLYRYPLYTCTDDSDPAVNILVIGFGQYGPRFLDACLQAGQCQNQELNVTVVSDNWTDKELYLADRPELDRFFTIDGSPPADGGKSYGAVSFKKRQLDPESRNKARTMLRRIFTDCFAGTPPHYIFIALGDDKLNAFVAEEACQLTDQKTGCRCVVSYAAEYFVPIRNSWKNMIPVPVNSNMEDLSLYPEIRRMAFNTHLLWEKNLSRDFGAIRSEFREKYNFDSCVSNVLSLKYKLHSLGIDLEDDEDGGEETRRGFAVAAEEFSRKALEPENQDALNELVWMEHRRWVTEKLCQGWTRITDLSECPAGDTKDGRNRRHVCLVRSGPDRMLADHYKEPEKWDRIPDRSLAELDDLDQLSVRLHREMKKRAGSVPEDLLSGSGIESIHNLIRGDGKAEAAFREWYACAKDLWQQVFGGEKRNRDQGEAALYDSLRDALIRQLPESCKEEAVPLIGAFDAEFRPVKAAAQYRDLKQEDMAIVENIPFVLTFTDHICMVIPYAAGSQSAVFGNVAAPAAVNPERIVCLYMIREEKDLAALSESFPGIREFLRSKNIRSSVRFMIGYSKDGFPEADRTEIEKRIRQAAGEDVCLFRLDSFDTPAETVAAQFRMLVEKEQSGGMHVVLEENDTPLSGMLLGGGFYDGMPVYRFRSRDLAFTSLSDCAMLRYYMDMLKSTGKMPYITADQIMAFDGLVRKGDGQPELFSDYTALRGKYIADRASWKALCTILGAFDADGQKNRAGHKDLSVSGLAVKPAAVRSGVIQLLKWLNREGFIRDLSVTRNGVADFTCISEQIRNVLADERKILEVYTYHKAKELGWFDDIEYCGRFRREGRGDPAGPELTEGVDIILTKGFRSLFVACRTDPVISKDSYFKLDSLTEKFGINGTAVLVADTGEPEEPGAGPKMTAEKRGRMLNVITISKESEIADIGRILCMVMEGDYN